MENQQTDRLFIEQNNEENVWHLCNWVKEHRPHDLDKCFCVFISNSNKTIPLWSQRCSQREDGCVVWDYHVIFLHEADSETMVYDLDSRLEFPCKFEEYVNMGIRSCENFKQQFRRVILLQHRFLGYFFSLKLRFFENKVPPLCLVAFTRQSHQRPERKTLQMVAFISCADGGHEKRSFRVIKADEFLATFASDRSHMLDENKEWLKPPPDYPCIKTKDSDNNISDFISMDGHIGVGRVMDFPQFYGAFVK